MYFHSYSKAVFWSISKPEFNVQNEQNLNIYCNQQIELDVSIFGIPNDNMWRKKRMSEFQ